MMFEKSTSDARPGTSRITCTACQGRTELFLCNVCTAELRKLLTDLPWWLTVLKDATLGHVKLGDGGRRSRRSNDLHGDDQALTKCTCGHPEHEVVACRAVDVEIVHVPILDDEGEPVLDDDGNPTFAAERREHVCDCDDYTPAVSVRRLTARLLAMGGLNKRARDELASIGNELSTAVRHLCETRGVEWLPLNHVSKDFIGPLMPGWRRMRPDYRATPVDLSRWLLANVGAIACDEGAGEFLHALQKRLRAIEAIVNRPVEPRALGPCPEPLVRDRCPDKGCREAHPHPCGTELTAPPEEEWVTCPACKTTKSADDLIADLMQHTEGMLFTIPELCHVVLPKLGESMTQSTLQRWHASERLQPRGYTIVRGKEIPQFVLTDVRRVRDEMAARRKRA